MGYLETANEEAIAAAARRRRPTVEKIELSPRGWGNWDDPGDELRALGIAGCSWSSKYRSLNLIRKVNPPT